MTAWTEVTSYSSFFGGGWAADLGVYTGPTADMPPPPRLPLAATEVDFIVGTPNPDGLVEDFHDHSYPEPYGYYESGRYRYGGTEYPFDGGPITVSGLHLFVAWYGSSAPAVPPESLVPVGWSSGGTLDIGHWSEWQEPLVSDHSGRYQDGDGNPSDADHYYTLISGAGAGFLPGTAYPNLAAALADVPTQLTNATEPAAGSAVSVGQVSKGGNFAGGVQFNDGISLTSFQAEVQFDFGSEHNGHLSILVDQMVATVVDPGYDGDAQPSLPPPLDALTFGVDYGYIPGTTDVAQYEDPAGTRLGWQDWNALQPLAADMDGSTYNAAINASGEYYADYDPYISFRKVDPADLSFAGIYSSEVGGPGASGAYLADVAWPTPGVGTELDRLSFSAISTGPAGPPNPIAPISLAGANDDESFTVVMQPSTMLGVVPPTHQPSSPDSVHNRGWESSMGIGYGPASDISIPPPVVRYSSGRWRYWIPAVSWRTVGGHFATVGGATLRILTPGVGWVDVVDGPA